MASLSLIMKFIPHTYNNWAHHAVMSKVLASVSIYKITYKMLFYSLHPSNKITIYIRLIRYFWLSTLHRYFWPSITVVVQLWYFLVFFECGYGIDHFDLQTKNVMLACMESNVIDNGKKTCMKTALHHSASFSRFYFHTILNPKIQ